MNFFKRTKGAVSIFLVIILLPTITVAGLFLDVSRVKLSEEVVSSSADLALNTVLSDYDKDLKDYFGLLASCQDTSEIIALSKQYFADSMVSTGVTTSDAEAYFDEVLYAFAGDDDIRDMLQLSVDGETNITATNNGAMDNPALLKTGIIEFMKYRAPINDAESLFEKITDSGVVNEVENVAKETEMTEAKKTFYEAEEKLIQQAETAYDAIKAYENYSTWTGNKFTDEKFLNDMSSFLNSPDGSGNSFETVFKTAHEKLVMNLYNTHNTDGTLSVSLIKAKSIPNPSAVTTYSDSSKASATKIENLLKSFNLALKNYVNADNTLNAKWNITGNCLSSDYQIQYWVVLTDNCSSAYSTYASTAYTLRQTAMKLENAVKFAAGGAMDELMNKSDVANDVITYDTPDANGKLSLQSIYDSLINKYNTSYKASVTGGGSSAFKSVTNQINYVNTTSNNEKLKLETVSEIYNIRNKIYKYQNDFGQAYTLAKKAKEETNKLKELLQSYKKAFDEWKAAANDSELDDSDLAKTDRDEIEELESVGIELFSESSVTELANRLNNIQTLCKTFQDDLNAIKYNNTAVKDISSYTKFRSAANLDLSKIVRSETELKQYVADSFSFSIGTQIQRIEIYDNRTSTSLADGDAYVITDSFHPNLQKTSLELYEWMQQKFDTPATGTPTSKSTTGFDVSDKSSAKDAKSSISEKSENTSDVDTSENTTGHNFSEWSGATLPSNADNAAEDLSISAKLSEVGNFASSLFSNFSETFMNSLVNTRDDLYMVDYTFSMFTYDTFEKEGCYALLDESVQKGLKPSRAEEKYQTVLSDWQSSNENKTLTLTPRNTSNNWAYGGEVEYILYGNDSNAKNKTTAYSQIYMIRYALDLPAVFNVYWNDATLNLIAHSLEAFAFIPAPLTKTLACLAITAAEAGVDISYLRQGLPVILLKSNDDLVCNYKSVFMGYTQSDSTDNGKITLQYSDYLKMFLFIKLVGSNENVIYTRTADVIQSNMALSTGNTQYALSKAQVYYDFEATVLVEPMWSRLLAIDNLGDISSEKNWRTISIKITRGY